jgi:hypothetical protein
LCAFGGQPAGGLINCINLAILLILKPVDAFGVSHLYYTQKNHLVQEVPSRIFRPACRVLARPQRRGFASLSKALDRVIAMGGRRVTNKGYRQ